MEILLCPVYFLLEFLVWCSFICRTRPVGVKKVRNVDDRTSPRETHVDVCMNNISEVGILLSCRITQRKEANRGFWGNTRANRRSKKCVRKLNKTELGRECVCAKREGGSRDWRDRISQSPGRYSERGRETNYAGGWSDYDARTIRDCCRRDRANVISNSDIRLSACVTASKILYVYSDIVDKIESHRRLRRPRPISSILDASPSDKTGRSKIFDRKPCRARWI